MPAKLLYSDPDENTLTFALQIMREVHILPLWFDEEDVGYDGHNDSIWDLMESGNGTIGRLVRVNRTVQFTYGDQVVYFDS